LSIEKIKYFDKLRISIIYGVKKMGLMKKVGVWAFMLGVFMALFVGVVTAFLNAESYMGLISAIMVLLGIIVGMLNISEKEVSGFIIAAIGLTSGSIAIAGLGPLLPGALGKMVSTTFTIFGVFVAGAVFFPALKAVYRISKD
jgi:hypothetical protein